VGGEWNLELDSVPGAKMLVAFQTRKGEVIAYSIVLVMATRFAVETIRVYDAAHGFNEMHRYTRGGGKQNGVVFSGGNLGEGMRMAMEAIKHGHREMIEGWKGRYGRGDEEL
jgi:hypothetical protein